MKIDKNLIAGLINTAKFEQKRDKPQVRNSFFQDNQNFVNLFWYFFASLLLSGVHHRT